MVNKNPDGSVTTTIVDEKSGTVTKTTEYPDGAKILALTPKDGETSIEITIPKKAGKVSVTIPTPVPPKPGEVAVFIHDDGTREILKTSVPTGNGLRISLEEGGGWNSSTIPRTLATWRRTLVCRRRNLRHQP